MLKSATESEMAKILRTLGNKDAIKILRFAKNGFDSSTDAYKKLGLSVKRYYYRLESLMNASLITKTNNGYELTPLGRIVYDSIEGRLVWAIEHIDHLRLAETLMKSKTIDKEALKGILGEVPDGRYDGLNVIQTYENLADTVAQLFDESTRNVYLATRYTDSRVVEAVWRAMKRGIEIWGLDGDMGLLSGRLKMLRMVISHPTSIKAFYDLWHSDTCHLRYGKVPFSFMVADDTTCCVEILNPTMSFFAAIRLDNNKTVCSKLVKTFRQLWDEGTEDDPLKVLSEDMMRGLREQGDDKSL